MNNSTTAMEILSAFRLGTGSPSSICDLKRKFTPDLAELSRDPYRNRHFTYIYRGADAHSTCHHLRRNTLTPHFRVCHVWSTLSAKIRNEPLLRQKKLQWCFDDTYGKLIIMKSCEDNRYFMCKILCQRSFVKQKICLKNNPLIGL